MASPRALAFVSRPSPFTCRARAPLERDSGDGFLSPVTIPHPDPAPHDAAAEADTAAAAAASDTGAPRPIDDARGGRGDGRRELLRGALLGGLFAAAATAGALVGFARHAGDSAAAPFAITGRMLLGVPATDGALVQWGAVAAGVLLHCAVVIAWALLFAALVRRQRGPVLFVTAALFAIAAHFVSARLLPPLLRLGHGARALPLQVVLLYAVLALALAIGMRLAFSSNASPSAASH